MAWNLVRLWQLTGGEAYHESVQRQLDFMTNEAAAYPIGYGMFLCALQEYLEPSAKVVIVSDSVPSVTIIRAFPAHALLRFQAPTDDYPMIDHQLTYYICEGTRCYPPVNKIEELPASERLYSHRH